MSLFVPRSCRRTLPSGPNYCIVRLSGPLFVSTKVSIASFLVTLPAVPSSGLSLPAFPAYLLDHLVAHPFVVLASSQGKERGSVPQAEGMAIMGFQREGSVVKGQGKEKNGDEGTLKSIFHGCAQIHKTRRGKHSRRARGFFAMCGGCGGPAGNISEKAEKVENGVISWSLLDKRLRDGWLDFGSFFPSVFLRFYLLPSFLIGLFLPFSLFNIFFFSPSFLPTLHLLVYDVPSTLHHSFPPPPFTLHPPLIPGKSRGYPLHLPPLSLGSFRPFGLFPSWPAGLPLKINVNCQKK